jgi:hypothetical protein
MLQPGHDFVEVRLNQGQGSVSPQDKGLGALLSGSAGVVGLGAETEARTNFLVSKA